MNFTFILVKPMVPENIGASARALKNMGFSDLALVNPCEFRTGEARWLAHASLDILDNVKVYNSLNDAIAGSDLVIGTTARHRAIKQDYLDVSDLHSLLGAKSESTQKISIVFGCEESGLSNNDIELCDITSSISMAVDYPSLNLSQAVLIYAYELSHLHRKTINKAATEPSIDNLNVLKNKLSELLDRTELKNNSTLRGRILERVSLATDKDLKLMHSFSGALLEITKESMK